MSIKKRALKSLKKYLKKRGFKISRLENINFFESLIYSQLNRNNSFQFIQIGANDGKRFDPIYEFVNDNKNKVSGYVLEPIPLYFEELKKTYKDCPNITPINAAIHNTASEMVIYRVDFENYPHLPEFAHGIGSFTKDHYKKTNIPDEAIVEEKVKCISFNELKSTHAIETIDLLLIDTEGYDAEIILNLELEKQAPKIIRFEHGLKTETMTSEIFQKVIAYLESYNYSIFIESSDALAYKKNILVEHLIDL